ncbi:ABC transporter ATP-binding protein [Actinomadura sp. BRA 177]|uniref:ABC transporter ATP-binding protein n=1 Tax=Actinomadura sp. BRA 177 TaxID=2745202 RepID=UPI001595953D|nr:oligopeptide/dipeptide ABC transporter ATP-binding protein [Actinomadura sp. BRA 177]NVI91280.1 ATP-binding cassette domain-containing protein [Actinomadura sp. BRA 177]
MNPLLQVEGLTKHYPSGGSRLFGRRSPVRAVDGIGFEVPEGQSLGLVGESGCGKSTTAKIVAGLERPTAGRVVYRGEDVARMRRREFRAIRPEIQMVFQDPYSSLSPRHTVGAIIEGPMEVNGIEPPGGRRARVRELLELVGLGPEHYNRFPHEFSGGQRQRIGIARALVTEPKLIIADEPVSALDVSVQAQVINLLRRLQAELGVSFLFIAHDLAVVRYFCHRVAVMYLGKVVEVADRETLYSAPAHPYTKALLSAAPDPTGTAGRERIRLTGDLPSPADPPSGCRFRTRCWKATERCASEEPVLTGGPHPVACHYPETSAESAADLSAEPA